MSYPSYIQGLRLILTLLCTGVLNYPTAVLLPTPGLDIATQRSAAVRCTRNVQDIIFAGNLWSADHNGQLPNTFLDLTNYLSGPALLQCPSHYRDPAITNWNDLSLENIDYFADPNPDAVFSCVCRVHETETLADGARVQSHERPGWPVFVANAISHFVTPGSDVRFEVVIAPDALRPVSLQWRREDPYFETNISFVSDPDSPRGGFWRTNRTTRFNVTALPNETNAVLSLQNVQTNDSAFYNITAQNEMGIALSRRARLDASTNLFATTNWSEIICQNNLRSISQLAIFWAADHHERRPTTFGEMTNRFGSPIFGWPLVLFCRDDLSRAPPSTWPGFDFQNTSYEFFLPDPQSTNVVFTRCKIHPFYADHHGQARTGPRMSPPILINDSIEFSLDIFFGRTNILERSSNFSTWIPVESYSTNYESILLTAPATQPGLFYRLRLGQSE